jgi:hypothetical protein
MLSHLISRFIFSSPPSFIPFTGLNTKASIHEIKSLKKLQKKTASVVSICTFCNLFNVKEKKMGGGGKGHIVKAGKIKNAYVILIGNPERK